MGTGRKAPKAKQHRRQRAKAQKTKWLFGYKGATEHNWLMATSYEDLVQQLAEKGMAAPDWHEDTGNVT